MNATLPRPRLPQYLEEPLHHPLQLPPRLKGLSNRRPVTQFPRQSEHTKKTAAVVDLELTATPQVVRLLRRHGCLSTPTYLSVLCVLEQKHSAAASCASYTFAGGTLDRQS